jgi:phage FluMu protein Com
MNTQRRIKSAQIEIRCFNLITDPEDSNNLYGLECGKLLMKKNIDGEAAGQILCSRCKTLYEITGNKITKKEVKNGNRNRQ